MAGEMYVIGPPRGDRFRLALDNDGRYLVNCGAVGQPRDGDPRASYLILDLEGADGRGSATWHRVPYDIERVALAIRAAGLPGRLADRLAVGL
jgi:diadenosine tetraphosphatase ApaH/serine/threonine PP2A family protein phosphatase